MRYDDYPDILEGLSYVLKDHYEVTTAGNLTEIKKEVIPYSVC